MDFLIAFIIKDTTDGMYIQNCSKFAKTISAKDAEVYYGYDTSDPDCIQIITDDIVDKLSTVVRLSGTKYFGVELITYDSTTPTEDISAKPASGILVMELTSIVLKTSKGISKELYSIYKDIANELSSKAASIFASYAFSITPSGPSIAIDTSEELERTIEEIKTKTKADISKPKETLADYVCGELLKEELTEIKDFMENESEYLCKGIVLPKGILFKGVPGTGKTYAARCIAGSTDCYFMTCTASSLQGMYIGSGTENIRNIFNGAKTLRKVSGKNIIIFIDELDSLGSRDSHGGNTGGEEDRTLNQLLAEMSGFEDCTGIMVLGATNYPERLDSALMRSGRFSRQITIEIPEYEERKELVKYYFNKISIPIDSDTNCDEITLITEGMTPADIKEISNEAGILTIRQKLSTIPLSNINEAINKVITKNIRHPDGTLDTLLVASHEIGHVMAEILYNKTFPIKVTNYSYGDAGGFTQSGKIAHGLITKEAYEANIKILIGGRAAESVLRGVETTGASSDFKRAKQMIRAYYETYNFETYDSKDIENVIINKLKDYYDKIVEDFSQENVLNILTELTAKLNKERILYTKDIQALAGTLIYKVEDIL